MEMFCNNTAFNVFHPDRPSTIYANVPMRPAWNTGIPEHPTIIVFLKPAEKNVNYSETSAPEKVASENRF